MSQGNSHNQAVGALFDAAVSIRESEAKIMLEQRRFATGQNLAGCNVSGTRTRRRSGRTRSVGTRRNSAIPPRSPPQTRGTDSPPYFPPDSPSGASSNNNDNNDDQNLAGNDVFRSQCRSVINDPSSPVNGEAIVPPISQSPKENAFDWDIPDDIGDREFGTALPDRGKLTKQNANAAAREWESVANSNGIALDRAKKLIKKMSKQGKLIEAALEKANKKASKARDCEAQAFKAKSDAVHASRTITSERESHKAEVSNLKSALTKAEKEEKTAKEAQAVLIEQVRKLEAEVKTEQAKNVQLTADKQVLSTNLGTSNQLQKAAIDELNSFKVDGRTERHRDATIENKARQQEESVAQKNNQRQTQYSHAIAGGGFRSSSGGGVILPQVTPANRFNNHPQSVGGSTIMTTSMMQPQQLYDPRRFQGRRTYNNQGFHHIDNGPYHQPPTAYHQQDYEDEFSYQGSRSQQSYYELEFEEPPRVIDTTLTPFPRQNFHSTQHTHHMQHVPFNHHSRINRMLPPSRHHGQDDFQSNNQLNTNEIGDPYVQFQRQLGVGMERNAGHHQQAGHHDNFSYEDEGPEEPDNLEGY